MTYISPHLARSKSGADVLLDRLRQEQFHESQQTAVDFLSAVFERPIDSNQLHKELKDGVLLCNLVNKLRPGTIKHVGQRDLAFIKMDNITRFLQGARQLGLNDAQLFETIDLFEAKDMSAVVHTILALRQLYLKQYAIASKEALGCKNVSDREAMQSVQEEPEQAEPSNQHYHASDLFTTHPGDDLFIRPPKSPLRLKSTHQKSTRRHSQEHRRAKKSIEDLKAQQHRRPSEPFHKSHTATNMSRSSSASSCSSSLSSTISSSSLPPTPATPATPVTPISPMPRSKESDQRNNHGFRSATLDRHIIKSMDALLRDDEKIREKLSLRSKDGLTCSHYQLGNCIGKGQFGSVYRALDLSSGGTVAVKRIKLEEAHLDDEIMKEVGLLKALSHPNVIQYVGFIRSKNHINIVLEYAENGSLLSTLKAFGAFPEKLVASFCIKILNGLEYLHTNDVVHCDLKAANILTTKTGDVKLSDFGVALNLKIKSPDAGTVAGTPNWMAPEVIELKGASTKSDIWSLGCTLVELITGKPPYGNLIAMSAMFRIVEDSHPPLPDNISSDMRDFLLCCFQKNPAERPTATALKQHPWIQRAQSKLQMTASGLSLYFRQHMSSTPSMLNIAGLQSSSDDGDDDGVFHPHNVSQISDHLSDENCMRISIDSNAGGVHHRDGATHRFIHTSFGKVMECKVCGDLINSDAMFCQVCALICHRECKRLAFACPPKVKDQQPSYDWVFSAKIYNRSRQDRLDPQDSTRSAPEIARGRKDVFDNALLDHHPQAESIRKCSIALGLTPQEQRALSENKALLSHILALQHMDPKAVQRLVKKRKDRRKGSPDECNIS